MRIKMGDMVICLSAENVLRIQIGSWTHLYVLAILTSTFNCPANGNLSSMRYWNA